MLSNYVNLLQEWNSKINLISRADIQNTWFNHILHSLSILFFVSIPAESKVLDLGTGGGLPGIPLAVLRKDLRFTLLDSIAKKMRAVEDMIASLSLTNVEVVTGRAESLAAQERFKCGYDVVISRAVAPLVDLVKWSKPFLRKPSRTHVASTHAPHVRHYPTPYLLALKGGDLTSELAVIRLKTGQKKIDVLNLTFDGSEEIGLQDKKIVIVHF